MLRFTGLHACSSVSLPSNTASGATHVVPEDGKLAATLTHAVQSPLESTKKKASRFEICGFLSVIQFCLFSRYDQLSDAVTIDLAQISCKQKHSRRKKSGVVTNPRFLRSKRHDDTGYSADRYKCSSDFMLANCSSNSETFASCAACSAANPESSR